ncbi:MAG: sugar ABC transporter ATP-binding protein [Eubacterium sp.]|nr:sugar ABC transporter ATP-binding protein [Eubacterium sp.]
MLTMTKITKQFTGVKALDNVSIHAEEGRVLGLIGINGAGKSTLMNVLGGVFQPDEGKIELNGIELKFHSPIDAYNAGIAFIHQEPQFFLSLTVAENIFISDLYMKNKVVTDKKKMMEQAEKYLSIIAANIKPNQLLEDVAIGQRQVIEIVRALTSGAQVIIFDEPTSSLGIHEKENLFKTIEKLKSEGKIIIYISHFLDEIMDVCDDYVVLRDGKLVNQGLISETDKSGLSDMIIGQKLEKLKKEEIDTSDREVVLKVEDIHHGNLLHGVGFELRKGEVLGIWGLMGAGRTEMIRAMLGLDRVPGGKAYINENGEMRPIKKHELLERVGYVTEGRHFDGLFLSKPVWMNITSANLDAYSSKGIHMLDMKKEHEDTEKYIDMLNIKVPNADVKVANLSGGNQQKVIFAKWIDKGANIFILDEPTRGVDVGAKLGIHKIIRELASQGSSVILITSEADEMVDLADRVLILRGGEIISEQTGADINQTNLMRIALEGVSA